VTAPKPTVLLSLEDPEGRRCVDIFRRADGRFGFKEFRRDPEDGGGWTMTADFSPLAYASQDAALAAAAATLGWLPRRP
jgi:hypothetical protein